MDEETQAEAQDEQAEAAAERLKLAKRIKSFRSTGKAAKITGLDARVARYKSIDSYHIQREHWKGDDDQLLPRLPLTFYHVDSLNADIGKRPHTPKVVAEEAASFPGDWQNLPQWLEAKSELQRILGPRYQERSDNEHAADFFTAILDVYREKACIDPQRATARLIKLTYGDVFWHNGYDAKAEFFGRCPHFAEVYKPEKVGADPKATRWVGNEFNGKYAWVEVDTTLRDLKEEYPDSAKEITDTSDGKDAQQGDEGLDPLDRTIVKELWFIADESLTETEEEYEEDEPILDEAGQMIPQLDEMGYPVLDEQGQPQPVTQTVVKTRMITVPAYPSGWKFAVFCNDKVLDSGPADEFPIHRDYCYEIAGQVFAHGVVDVVRTFNTNANRFLDQIIKNTERTGDNLVFWNTQSNISNPEKVLEGRAKAIGIDGPVNEGNLQVVQGITAADGLYRALELNLKLAEQITGNIDAMSQENLPRTASGKYVYAAESGQQARISEIAKHSDDCERSLYRSMVKQSLRYDDQPMALKVKSAGAEANLSFTPNDLHTNDFEIRFDIALDGAPQESPDPAERNAQRKEMWPWLMSLPPTIANGALDEQDVPNKESIRATLKAWHAEQAEQAQGKPQGDPVEQAKAAGQMAKDFSQSMQDISAALKDAGRVDLALSLMLWAVTASRTIAMGQDPDMAYPNHLVAEIAAMPIQAAPPPQGDPMTADPMQGGIPQ